VFAALLLAVALPSGFYASVHAGRVAASERRARAEAAHQAQIARDNDLLQSVDRELAEQVAPAMQPLQVEMQADGIGTNTEEER